MGMRDLEPPATVHWQGEDVPVTWRSCPICQFHNRFAPVLLPYAPEPWTLKQCLVCGLVYLEQAPHYEALEANLSWESSFDRETERRRRETSRTFRLSRMTRWRMRLLPRRNIIDMLAAVAAPGPVIDLGCGPGGWADLYPDDYVPYGVEISPALAQQARETFRARGGDAVQASALAGLKAFPDGFFTGATLRSYLEHEADPLAVMEQLHRVLAPHGVAVIKVPNFASWNRRLRGANWCGFRYPDHLNHFTPDTLARLARRAGFEYSARTRDRLPTSDNMYAVLCRMEERP